MMAKPTIIVSNILLSLYDIDSFNGRLYGGKFHIYIREIVYNIHLKVMLLRGEGE